MAADTQKTTNFHCAYNKTENMHFNVMHCP